jgi:hypothetical protein
MYRQISADGSDLSDITQSMETPGPNPIQGVSECGVLRFKASHEGRESPNRRLPVPTLVADTGLSISRLQSSRQCDPEGLLFEDLVTYTISKKLPLLFWIQERSWQIIGKKLWNS